MDPEFLPSRESDRSIQNGEARGELRIHSSHVRVFNTCNTYAHAPLTYDVRTLKKCALIRGYALNSGVRLLTRLYGTISVHV